MVSSCVIVVSFAVTDALATVDGGVAGGAPLLFAISNIESLCPIDVMPSSVSVALSKPLRDKSLSPLSKKDFA